MYDIIGDIHGYAGPLKKLLEKFGYTNSGGDWQHPVNKAIFVGDYIDRGPAIRETLEIIKRMTDSGNAIALLGNHELNAMAFHRTVNGMPLRAHTEKNIRQHERTLEQFRANPEEWQMYLDWFYTLPLFFEDAGIRVVHACWDEHHIQWLKSNCGSITASRQQKPLTKFVMNTELLAAGYNKEALPYRIVNDTIKGKEYSIPQQYEWKDKEGLLRKSNRVKWWVDPRKNLYEKWLFDCPTGMKGLAIASQTKPYVYPLNAPPVFFGHYWLHDKQPALQDKNIVCLDYSIADKGSLVGYRWSGCEPLNKNNFVKADYAA